MPPIPTSNAAHRNSIVRALSPFDQCAQHAGYATLVPRSRPQERGDEPDFIRATAARAHRLRRARNRIAERRRTEPAAPYGLAHCGLACKVRVRDDEHPR